MRKIYNALIAVYWNFIHSHYPYFWVKHLYKRELGKEVDLKNPRDINEKILWLGFFGFGQDFSLRNDSAIYSFRLCH